MVSATAGHPRYPLVLSGSRRALADAERLLPPGTILENLVGEAIADGRLHGARRVGEGTDVFIRDFGVVVAVRKTESPLTGRKAWRPLSVRPLDARRDHPKKEERR